jgi:RNA polymerase sigma-70 factor (ECF subfamily)
MSIATRIRHDALDDAELVRLAQAGDRDGFRVIMQRGNQRLYRVARSIVQDDDEAEDVVQETYVRAFAALDAFRGESSVMTWLTRIALNEAQGRLRRRRPTVDLQYLDCAHDYGAFEMTFSTLSFEGNPEAEAARAQIRELIEQAIDDLPEAFRIVFVMRDVQECNIEETAASLDLKPETVKTRLHRARRLLRQSLDEKVASTITGVFPFLGVRCQRITATALQRLANEGRLR